MVIQALKLGTTKYQVLFCKCFWCNILYWNCYHTHDIYTLNYMLFHVEMIHNVNVKSVENISRKSNNLYFHCTLISCISHVGSISFEIKYYIRKHLQKSTWFIFIKVQDFNISDIFYNIQNLKKWRVEECSPISSKGY